MNSTPTNRSQLTSGLILLALTTQVLWGGNVVAIKVGLSTSPPIWSAFWRILIGTVVVGLWALVRRVPMGVPREERGSLAALGLLFTVQISALNVGVDLTSPAYGVVLLCSHPIFANVIGHFFVPEDRLSWGRVAGLAAAFGGICVVFLGRPSSELAAHPLLGNLTVTASAFLLGSRTVYTQRLVQTIDPVRTLFWQMIFGLPCFLVVAALSEPALLKPLSSEAVFAILYQGVVIAGFGFIVFTFLLTRTSPGTLSMFAFTTPIFGVLLSAWFFSEEVTGRLAIGVIAVAVGIATVAQQSRRRSVAALPESAGSTTR